MSKFAHIETGFALDPHESDSAEAYLKRFTEDATKDWLVVEVPKGTEHGAKDNGDGTFTNPTQPALPRPQKRTVTLEEVINLIPATVIKSLEDSTIAAVIKRYRLFLARPDFTYAKGVELSDYLQAATLFTDQENIDFKAAWPEA